MNRSSIKTWLRRNKFKPVGYGNNWRSVFKYGSLCKKGRLYRIRYNLEWLIDIGEKKETFDRWANSIEITVTLVFFMRHGYPFNADAGLNKKEDEE